MDFRRITRVKNITNTEEAIRNKKAYLDKIKGRFILHFPNRFRKRVLDTNEDEYIVLYQRMGMKNKRYLTHLVKPIDNVYAPKGKRKNYIYGRYVKVIAFADNKIPYNKTLLKKINFRNKGWGNAVTFEDDSFVPSDKLKELQEHLLEIFKPFMVK